MLERNFTLEKTLEIAKKAKDYARSQIIKGSTQLENNSLSQNYFDSLVKGIEKGIRGLIDELTEEKTTHNPLKIDADLLYYESVLAVTSKYSLGNCEELTIQALDCVLNGQTGISAEVFKIENGDHVFLVLNRNPYSSCYNPDTWGENVVICDPWSNKVYKAADYPAELKSFYRSGKKNHINDFNFRKYWTTLHPRNLDTNFLQQEKNIRNLKAKCWDESNDLIGILKNYQNKLVMEKKFFTERGDHNDQKTLVISKKIDLISQLINRTNRWLKNTINLLSKSFMKEIYGWDYEPSYSKLVKEIKKFKGDVMAEMQFSKEDQFILLGCSKKNKTTKLMGFFGINFHTQSYLENNFKDISQLSNNSPLRKGSIN